MTISSMDLHIFFTSEKAFIFFRFKVFSSKDLLSTARIVKFASNSEYSFSTIDSIPLNAAIKIIKAAVVTAIPITEIRVIK